MGNVLVQREVEVVVGVSRCISTWLLRGNEQALGQDRLKNVREKTIRTDDHASNNLSQKIDHRQNSIQVPSKPAPF